MDSLLHFGDIHHAPVSKFFKFGIVNVSSVKDFVVVIMARSEHERVVGVYYGMNLCLPFFSGCRPTPLKIALENSVMVVESMDMQLAYPFFSSASLAVRGKETFIHGIQVAVDVFEEPLRPSGICSIERAVFRHRGQSRHDTVYALLPSWMSLFHVMSRTDESQRKALWADE